MSEQKKKAPLETIKNGGVVVSLWEQKTADGQRFVTVSICKIYKDKQSGEWKDSCSFNTTDFLKLQAIMSEVQQKLQQRNDQAGSVNLPQKLSDQRNAVMQKANRNDRASPASHTPVRNPFPDRAR